MGLYWFRLGNEYGDGQFGNAEAIMIGSSRLKKQTKVKANADTFLMAA
jgi:hypothetical protein